jgi:hypothetical protein
VWQLDNSSAGTPALCRHWPAKLNGIAGDIDQTWQNVESALQNRSHDICAHFRLLARSGTCSKSFESL